MTITARISPAPLRDINTTPLIDVMLVLLVMLIITIPRPTHSVPIDLPRCEGDCQFTMNEDYNRLTLDASDRLLWNGAPVDRAELASILAQVRAFPVEPELQFAPDGAASYDASAKALAVIEDSGISKFGFVGNEQFHAFGKASR